jgi:hypothetical protein
LNTRLRYYKENQKKIPSITGLVIPEAVFSGEEYHRSIYHKIKNDIAEFDPEEILDPVWVNSRGAISRFDRGSIEIRLMDVQECPAADLAILSLVIETIKALVNGKFVSHKEQMSWSPEPLAAILEDGVEKAERTVISNKKYLAVFGVQETSLTMGELWQHIYRQLQNIGELKKHEGALNTVLKTGSLSTRIIKALSGDVTSPALTRVYRELSNCLAENRMFHPN